MKRWLAQGGSGRRVTLSPGTSFLYNHKRVLKLENETYSFTGLRKHTCYCFGGLEKNFFVHCAFQKQANFEVHRPTGHGSKILASRQTVVLHIWQMNKRNILFFHRSTMQIAVPVKRHC